MIAAAAPPARHHNAGGGLFVWLDGDSAQPSAKAASASDDQPFYEKLFHYFGAADQPAEPMSVVPAADRVPMPAPNPVRRDRRTAYNTAR